MKQVIRMTPMVLLLLLILLLNSLVIIKAEQPSDTFFIQNADSTNTLSLTGSSTLTDLIQNIDSRFVIQYANGKNIILIYSPPIDLVSVLQSAADRFIIQYANAKSSLSITPPPLSLVSLIQNLADRFVVQYANASSTHTLEYPIGLVGDLIEPVFEQITAQRLGAKLTISVNTNEYTLAQVDYGILPGQYTNTIIDGNYNYEHILNITGLQTDATYYYQITIIDRSGNSTLSSEGSSSPSTVVYLYLPLLVK